MTEIVQNNNSMKFDLLETGNGSPSASEDHDFFNTMLGNMDIEGDENSYYEQEGTEKDIQTEAHILEILQILNDANLNLSEDRLEDIKLRIKNFFEEIKFNADAQLSLNPENATIFTNEKFLHLMKFLEKLKELMSKQPNDQNIRQDLDLVLDKVRTKLNEHLKNTLAKKINVNVKAQNHTDISTNTEQSSRLKGIPSAIDRNSKDFDVFQAKRETSISSKNADLKIEVDANNLSDRKSLKNTQQQDNELNHARDMANKAFNKNTDIINQNSNIGTFSKELDSETTLLRQPQPITSANKLDTLSNSEPTNTQKPSMFSQENNDKLLQTLNMLSRTWGNKLIEKIEKSKLDGIEQLEIALTPKSLGRLNVTINIHDTVTKINIVAESASAAALLGEAEQKLSQMMEAYGLKLASLQTLTQQFGSNQKGKGQDHKLASIEKKSSIEEGSNSTENTKELDSESEGLNLIA